MRKKTIPDLLPITFHVSRSNAGFVHVQAPAGRHVCHASVASSASKYLVCYVCSPNVSKFLAPAGRYVYSNGGFVHVQAPAERNVYHVSVVLFTSKYLVCYVCSPNVSKFLAPAGRYVYSNGGFVHVQAPAGRHVCHASVASSESKTYFGFAKKISSRFPLQRSGMSIE